MVKKKSILKDALREISTTKKRFLSLLLIITIGVGFYVGLKSTSEDMKNTAKQYYKDTNLMDYKVVSNTGFSKNDEEQFKKINGINEVMSVKTLDVATNINGNDYVIKLNSINEDLLKENKKYINKLVLTNGKFPTTINEGLVEESFLKDNNLKIGDLVTLSPQNKNDLRAKKIKIVGTVKSSYYSSKDRGTSEIGDGKVNYFMYVNENNFNTDYYNEVYITIKNADTLDTYSTKYEEYINGYKEEIKNVSNQVTKEKIDNIIKELDSNILGLENNLNELYQSTIPDDSINDEIKKISSELNTLKQKREKIKSPTSYVLSRNETPSFYEYKLETERIKNISKVFPLIFFLVAALVSLTSMTRIVEEERTQMGTLRAIGYNKFDVVFKYILYAFLASFIGSILGSLLFYKLIPLVISKCYGIFYEMPSLITSFQMRHVFFASLLACLSTVVAAIIVFIKDSREMPSSLMRPKAPTPGKRVLLEKITSFWGKLSFSNKVTFRNIFRYKKRMFMTITGICGCTALLLTAFGLKDSILGIADKQFEKINKYDVAINVNDSLTEEENTSLEKDLLGNKKIKKMTWANQTTIDIKNNNKSESVYLIIPKNVNELKEFITLKNSNKSLSLNNDGIIISEKLSKLLKVKIGDEVNLVTSTNKNLQVKIAGITENYIDHYAYISPSLYETLTKEKISYNYIYANIKGIDNEEKKELQYELANNDKIISNTFTSDNKEKFEDSMSTLTYVTFILILAAASLAFVVLYNLASINISERKRELATIKVLGFYDEEVTNYIHKETIILTIMGAIVGLIFGSFLTYYVVKACETNMFMFSFNIKIISYLLSFLITIIFLLIVNVFMHFELKKLDMIEALKSVE